jgi:biotin transport system substrate-specific component
MNASIPAVLNERVIRGRAVTNVALVIAGSAIIAIAAQIAIPVPFTPVPLTLQPIAVLLVGAALGSTRGAAAASLYLLEGLSGLPVFAQGHGGPLWLLGPTAGYLYSYPFAAFISGWFSERGWGNTVARAICGMLIALAVIYAGGWSWLAISVGPRAAFTMGIAPFAIADAIKVIIGAALLPYAQRLIARV